jgi:septal ring factor EnvC (AmiA/AmiB activator)
MPTGFGRTATHDLSHVGLTLAPRPQRGRWLVIVAALVVAALAAGLGAGELLRQNAPPVVVRTPAPASEELAQLRQQLEQAKAALRIAEARGQELERQVDSLNQKLAESQDELTFFRKAREGRKH